MLYCICTFICGSFNLDDYLGCTECYKYGHVYFSGVLQKVF
jgi:hypothetical protein